MSADNTVAEMGYDMADPCADDALRARIEALADEWESDSDVDAWVIVYRAARRRHAAQIRDALDADS